MRGLTSCLVKDVDSLKRKDLREKKVLKDLEIGDKMAESAPPPF
jgi:hypothetical protein